MTSSSRIDGGQRRIYRSALRTRQAQETRARILHAAAAAFSERGYAGTSLAEIGRRAGVSTESVAANGAKRTLLMAAFEQVLGGREGRDPVAGRPEVQQLFGMADVDAMLDTMADLAVTSAARTVGLWRALSAAATDDPEVGEMYQELAQRRRLDNRVAIDSLAARGLTREDRDPQQLADILALLSGFDPFQLFVREFGWSHQQLRDWWVDMVRQLILKR